MLNDNVLAKLSDSEIVTHTKMVENYWQAADDYEAAKNDTEWCLINNCSVDDAHKYKSLSWDVLLEFEGKMARKYNKQTC